MKEYNSGIPGASWYVLLILWCASPMTTAQSLAAEQGWEVDQELLVNMFNSLSPLEIADDSSSTLVTDETLIPVFHSLTVTSPDMSGLRGAAAITQHTPVYGSFNKLIDHKSAMQLQARASYSSYFDKGNVNFWLGALWQQQAVNSITTGIRADTDSFGYNIGIDVNYADLSITGSYYNGQALSDSYFNPYQALDAANCSLVLCTGSDNQGYVLKGFYAFTEATRFGISYGESSHYTYMKNAVDSGNELWTVGLYHDVNSWFKIVAEYSNLKSSNVGFDETSDMITVGGYIRW
jgi:hypothetical protein